jgi:hypothetical protein
MVTQTSRDKCKICLDDLEIAVKESRQNFLSPHFRCNTDAFELQCLHTFCVKCVRAWVECQVESRKVPMICPAEGCEMHILPSDVQEILSSDMLTQFTQTLIENNGTSELLFDGASSMYCSNKRCSALVVIQPEEELTEEEKQQPRSNCPHCGTALCRACKVPWHTKLSCEEFQALPDNDRQIEDIQLLNMIKKKAWKRCPRCKIIVARSAGCNHMRCHWYVGFITFI